MPLIFALALAAQMSPMTTPVQPLPKGTGLPPPGTEEAQVMAPVTALLNGIAARDATAIGEALRPDATATSTMPATKTISCRANPSTAGDTASVACMLVPTRRMFATVPRPGRWRSGIQSSSTRKPTMFVTQPMPTPVEPSSPASAKKMTSRSSATWFRLSSSMVIKQAVTLSLSSSVPRP